MERHGEDLVRMVEGRLYAIGVVDVDIKIQYSLLFRQREPTTSIGERVMGTVTTMTTTTTSLVAKQVLNGKYRIVHEAKSSSPIGVGMMSSPAPIDGNVGPIRQEQMRCMQRSAGHVLTVPPQERPSLGILWQMAVLGEPVRVQYGVEVLGPRGIRRGGIGVVDAAPLLRREGILQQIQIHRAVKAFQVAAGGPLGLHDGEERRSLP